MGWLGATGFSMDKLEPRVGQPNEVQPLLLHDGLAGGGFYIKFSGDIKIY